MSPEPKIGPLPKCSQYCKWSTIWCLTNPYCRTRLLPPRTSSTTLACATCLVATTTSTMQDSPVGFWRWRQMNIAKTGDVLILCLQVEDEWIFFTYPLDCLGIRSDLDLDLRNRRSANPCFFWKFKANELISAITSMIQPEAWKWSPKTALLTRCLVRDHKHSYHQLLLLFVSLLPSLKNHESFPWSSWKTSWPCGRPFFMSMLTTLLQAHRLSISLDTEGRILTSPSSPGPGRIDMSVGKSHPVSYTKNLKDSESQKYPYP